MRCWTWRRWPPAPCASRASEEGPGPGTGGCGAGDTGAAGAGRVCWGQMGRHGLGLTTFLRGSLCALQLRRVEEDRAFLQGRESPGNARPEAGLGTPPRLALCRSHFPFPFLQVNRDGKFMFCPCGNKLNIIEVEKGALQSLQQVRGDPGSVAGGETPEGSQRLQGCFTAVDLKQRMGG